MALHFWNSWRLGLVPQSFVLLEVTCVDGAYFWGLMYSPYFLNFDGAPGYFGEPITNRSAADYLDTPIMGWRYADVCPTDEPFARPRVNQTILNAHSPYLRGDRP